MSLHNGTLMRLAMARVTQDAREKVAVVPPGGGAPAPDPAAGGAPPMGAPPAGAPPMGAPPAGGAPMPDPSMGMMPPAAAAGMAPPMPDPMGMMGMTGAAGMPNGMQPPQKLKPEQMMMQLDFRLYNLQMQVTAIMNALQIQLPAGALVTPPGSTMPVAEAAVPGGPQDPTESGTGAAAALGGGAGGSAIGPIEPMQGASPELAAAGGGGGGEKAAAADDDLESLLDSLDQSRLGSRAAAFGQIVAGIEQINEKIAATKLGQPYSIDLTGSDPCDAAPAVGALLRSRQQREE